ncbi:MAG TPA: GNAT family N-acetyltransferase [Streptosporangiaceae bacterium]
MRFERFDPAAEPGMVRLCHEIYLAGQPVDDPKRPAMTEHVFGTWLALGWTEDHPQAWLARDAAGQIRGWCSLTLPERENTNLAYMFPLVRPADRRQGIGTGLVRHTAEQAHAHGRAALATEARQGSAGEAFCRALGGQPGLSEATRVLRLDTIPAGQLARLRARAEGAAAGYSLISWEGQVPERYLGQMARLAQAMSDAPRDAGYEGQLWDVARMRQDMDRVAAQGLRYYTVAARWDRTGELAGMTQLGIDPLRPDCGFQELTVVARRHRGHRLGLLVKVAMLDLLARHEPLLERIYTGNADSNERMLAINAELGFAVLDHWRPFRFDVADVLARPVPAQS